MSLSNDDVRRIAGLARIAITPEESGEVLERLNRVLALINEMRAVDTTGIEPMAHALELSQRLREDAVTEPDRHRLYQSVAPAGPEGRPEVQDGLYLVPKVIE
jgi:aspartyl-tRNA(Asn)/glutamyl-tRNA(Gln) amidotransferase subunit C